MPLNEMRLYLPHRAKQDAHDNQEASAAKKSRRHSRDAKPSDHGLGNHRNNRQEERSGESQSSQCILEEFRSRFPWSIAGNISVVFFQIVRDLRRLNLNRNPEITEEKYQNAG